MSGANNDPEILLPGVGILKVTLSLFVDTVPVKCDRYEWQDCIETFKSLYLIDIKGYPSLAKGQREEEVVSFNRNKY